ncbi:phosphotransferase family protein [Mycobacterium kyogaense]|uniref:phosphotransferase family protein n=1 Tax=Mycobacterium kyogaense TaxID=2212479 RepID=UPI000DACE361|nr:phosphotransferase family protein [Mycobacterium kyogaense]
MTVQNNSHERTAASVTSWLLDNGIAVSSPLEMTVITGGQSNLTYRLQDREGRTFVLRRPPSGNVLETAHSMSREWRFLTALHPTDVPVPTPIAACEDDAVIGAGFYVMECVEGLVLHTAEDAAAIDAAARRALTANLAQAMSQLHTVDVESCGLSDIGRGEDYVARQLKRWQGQWDKTRSMANLDVGAIDAAHHQLARDIPQQRSISVVHGDFRLGNAIASEDGHVRAILDWELATLGDPRADLGWLLLSWEEPGPPRVSNPTGVAPSTLTGFGSRAEFVAAYAASLGEEVSGEELNYFVAFAAWRWACISAGVYARYEAGAMGGQEADLDAILRAVIDHAEYALDLLSRRADAAGAATHRAGAS